MQRWLCLWLALALSARADELTKAADTLLEKYKEAVLGVKVVAKVAVPGRESTQEIKVDAVGIALDPKGLTAASLRIVEPSEVLSRASGRTIQAEVTDIKLVLADRTEVNAALVLRDKDLDLAILRPTEPLPKPVSVVPLNHDVKPELMEQVIAMSRSHRTPRLEPVFTDGRIAAIVEKPRLFYVATPALQNSGPGSAVFTLDGRFIGQILLQRTPKGDTWGVIIPAADIAETAKQAPEEPPRSKPVLKQEPQPAAESKTTTP